MCWMSSVLLKPKKAKADIWVYKVVKESPYSDYVDAFYTGYRYKLGETYKLVFGIEPKINTFGEMEITYGFHSYSINKSVAGANKYCLIVRNKNSNDFLNFNATYDLEKLPIIALCKIPKGATYYENADGELVSNEIIIVNTAKLNRGDSLKCEQDFLNLR